GLNHAASAPAAYASRMALPPSMQGLLPAGWLAFTGRESNSLDRYKRFQVIHPPFLDLAWRKGSFILNPPSTFASFDHLVGKCEQRVRYVEPHRLCGFQIEHEQEARRLLDRQVGGFSAFEDAIDQGGRTLENLAPVWSIRHQAAFTS